VGATPLRLVISTVLTVISLVAVTIFSQRLQGGAADAANDDGSLTLESVMGCLEKAGAPQVRQGSGPHGLHVAVGDEPAVARVWVALSGAEAADVERSLRGGGLVLRRGRAVMQYPRGVPPSLETAQALQRCLH
jgi:hypothetical protein